MSSTFEIPAVTCTKNELVVVVELVLEVGDPAVKEGLMKGHTVVIPLHPRWHISLRLEIDAVNSQFKVKCNLLPIPTVEEIYELGNIFERKVSVYWQYYVWGRSYWGENFSNHSTTHSYQSGREGSSCSPSDYYSHESCSLPGAGMAQNGDSSKIKIAITLTETLLPVSKSKLPSWITSAAKVGGSLLDPSTGDVIFLVRDGNDTIRELYAYKSILSTASEYFKSRLEPEWRTPPPETPVPTINDDRQVIDMTDPENEIDFTTLHNILYFLYTGTVNLHVPLREQTDEYHFPEGYPEAPDPYALYRSSDKFLLDDLTQRCYTHLKHGVSHENVAERLFHKDTRHYEDLKDLYLQYIINNYDNVKKTEGWRRAVTNEDENTDLEVMNHRFKVLYYISQALVKDPAK